MIGKVLRSIYNGKEINEYVFQRKLGEGAFASVWQAHSTKANIDVAIKVLPKQFLSDEASITRLHREINLQKGLDHPYIAKFYEHIEDEENHYLVMEHVVNGNLLDYVNDRGRLNDVQARKYFLQIISVLDYLHNTKHIAHRDLKAENVLLDKNYNIKIIDFGLSNSFTESQPNLSTACGSPAYAAPEMIKGEQYTKAADIWSAGILLYAICACELPFDDEDTQIVLQRIVYTEPRYPHFMSSALVDLLKKMLIKNPQKRITIEGIKNHHWFSKVDYSTVVPPAVVNENGNAIDKVIVDLMREKGIDSEGLSECLLMGEHNGLTSIYEQLRRNYVDSELISRQKANLAKPQFPTRPSAVAGGQQKTLALPTAVPTSGRRMTRPVVLKRPVGVAIPAQRRDSRGRVNIPAPSVE